MHIENAYLSNQCFADDVAICQGGFWMFKNMIEVQRFIRCDLQQVVDSGWKLFGRDDDFIMLSGKDRREGAMNQWEHIRICIDDGIEKWSR